MNYRICDTLDVVLAGSIYVKGENPAAVDRLKADVLSANRDLKINFHILKQPPVMGAILWALAKTGAGQDSCELYDRVRLQFQDAG